MYILLNWVIYNRRVIVTYTVRLYVLCLGESVLLLQTIFNIWNWIIFTPFTFHPSASFILIN